MAKVRYYVLNKDRSAVQFSNARPSEIARWLTGRLGRKSDCLEHYSVIKVDDRGDRAIRLATTDPMLIEDCLWKA